MKITIIHPSRSRPQMAFQTANNWLSSADDKDNIQYIMSLDSDDPMLSKYSYLIPEYSYPRISLAHGSNKSAIEAINKIANYYVGRSPEKNMIVIVVSDDFSCELGWDTKLLASLGSKSDFIVKTQDGIQPTLITLPIMDKVYYQRFGYIYHPDYLHMHSDEEMTIVGHMLGRVITLPISFPHNHYSIGGMRHDSINRKNDSTYSQGKSVIERRALNNFGIEKPLIKRGDIKWK